MAELVRRRTEGGVRYFAPITDTQRAAYLLEMPGTLILGGNRGGKTYLGGATVASIADGIHPIRKAKGWRGPIKIWCCSQDLPGKLKAKGDAEQEIHKQLEMLKKQLPRDLLKGGSWATAYSPSEQTIRLTNGDVIVFKGYSQGPLQFESDAVHVIWLDEEPPDRNIFISCQARLIDHKGIWFITATPLLSLEGRGWIKELWDKREEGKALGAYRTFQLYTGDNTTLDKGEIEKQSANWTDEEKRVRLYGDFANLGGMVLSEWDEGRHGCHDFLPPAHWKHFLVIDPGWNVAAHLFAALDPEGTVWLYAEYYAEKIAPVERIPVLHAMWQAFGSPHIRVLMDPAGMSIKRNTLGQEAPSDADEYYKIAKQHNAGWMVPTAADNSDPYAWRVKRRLQMAKLRVCRSLKKFRWEVERWTRQKERQGPAAMERAIPDRPIDRWNHLMDTTRYLCNELPEIEVPDAGPQTQIEEYWAKIRQRFEKEENPQREYAGP